MVRLYCSRRVIVAPRIMKLHRIMFREGSMRGLRRDGGWPVRLAQLSPLWSVRFPPLLLCCIQLVSPAAGHGHTGPREGGDRG